MYIDKHGDLRHCWDDMMIAVSSSGLAHIKIADQIKNEFQPRIDAFHSRQRKMRKASEDHYKKAHLTRLKAYDKVCVSWNGE